MKYEEFRNKVLKKKNLIELENRMIDFLYYSKYFDDEPDMMKRANFSKEIVREIIDTYLTVGDVRHVCLKCREEMKIKQSEGEI